MKRLAPGSLLLTAAAAAAAAAAAGRDAHAGGLGRHTPFSARAYGFGGAFAAIADDPTALHYNPAGLALQRKEGFLFGLTMALAPREYTPITDANGTGTTQASINSPNFLPVLGYTTRLRQKGVPSRLALGLGLWNAYGGSADFEKGPPGIPAVNSVTNATIELVPGMAYEVNDFLSVGIGFRLGFGILVNDSTAKPSDAEFSAFGVGAGATLGLMIAPTEALQLGLVYRTPLTTNLSGSGTVTLETGSVNVDVTHKQRWPQAAAAGVSYNIGGKVRLSAQLDWTDWSHVDELVFTLDPVIPRQVEPTEFQDSIALHGGGEVAVSESLAVRAGVTFDGNAVPDRTMQRHYLGGPHYAGALGVSYGLTRSWRLDGALEYLTGPGRTVDDNKSDYEAASWAARANANPGEFRSSLFTFELNAAYLY